MEAAGLGVGIDGLATAFSSAVDCFQYIRLGQNFGDDFKTSTLQLDMTWIRLSRWGKSIGLTDVDLENTQNILSTQCTQEEIKVASQCLDQIIKLFEKAEGQARDISEQPSLDPDTDLDDDTKTLHKKLGNLSLSRKPKGSRLEKAKWALYRKQEFNDLINGIDKLVEKLGEHIKPPKDSVEAAIQLELDEIAKTNMEFLERLEVLVKNKDREMLEAIGKHRGSASEAAPREYLTMTVGPGNRGFASNKNTGNINAKFEGGRGDGDGM